MKELSQQYICCPQCGDDEIEPGETVVLLGKAYQSLSCGWCNYTWQNVFIFAGVILPEGE